MVAAVVFALAAISLVLEPVTVEVEVESDPCNDPVNLQTIMLQFEGMFPDNQEDEDQFKSDLIKFIVEAVGDYDLLSVEDIRDIVLEQMAGKIIVGVQTLLRDGDDNFALILDALMEALASEKIMFEVGSEQLKLMQVFSSLISSEDVSGSRINFCVGSEGKSAKSKSSAKSAKSKAAKGDDDDDKDKQIDPCIPVPDIKSPKKSKKSSKKSSKVSSKKSAKSS